MYLVCECFKNAPEIKEDEKNRTQRECLGLQHAISIEQYTCRFRYGTCDLCRRRAVSLKLVERCFKGFVRRGEVGVAAIRNPITQEPTHNPLNFRDRLFSLDTDNSRFKRQYPFQSRIIVSDENIKSWYEKSSVVHGNMISSVCTLSSVRNTLT